MMKTAIIGASGYIGSYLFRRYREIFPDCIGTGFSQVKPELTYFDLSQPNIKNLQLEETGHKAVLIASAQTDMPRCQTHPKESYAVNVRGPLQLIEQLAKTSIIPIFISTDNVFDGQKGNYSDQDKPNPITEYGKQKAEVEREIPHLTKNYIILRIGKIYGTEWNDGTLIDALAAPLSRKQTVEVAPDKICSPTHLSDLASMLFFIQQQGMRGLFNVCMGSSYSRYQIALKLAENLGVSSTLVKPVYLATKPMPVRFPLDTSLIRSEIFKKMQTPLLTMEEAIQIVTSNWSQHRG